MVELESDYTMNIRWKPRCYFHVYFDLLQVFVFRKING
jgi:hypothetical protein